MAILEVKQLTKIYGTKKMAQEVLRDINMSIEEGELLLLWVPLDLGKRHY
ncbi:ABC transporter ATP-binding protein VraF [Staphylococcus aureus]|uniref:ABC transporter ATP-binding protein VraF n=1 Tax=Staphylococcus aureus TaxID=1280 RepID=A0A380EG06_STAAU|nr:ABC transporter ATP-binding protein VraF [Staphylococcus aureus]VDZ34480.1 ABC transporter ATP-binding protein VraF [Staphylococcus aureus]